MDSCLFLRLFFLQGILLSNDYQRLFSNLSCGMCIYTVIYDAGEHLLDLPASKEMYFQIVERAKLEY